MNTEKSNEQPGKLHAPWDSTCCFNLSSRSKLPAKLQPAPRSLRGLEAEGFCVGVSAGCSLVLGTAALFPVVRDVAVACVLVTAFAIGEKSLLRVLVPEVPGGATLGSVLGVVSIELDELFVPFVVSKYALTVVLEVLLCFDLCASEARVLPAAVDDIAESERGRVVHVLKID